MGALLDLVASDVALKQRGKRWIGLCPFHNERTPSFHVFLTPRGHERFHCFGCGADGEAIEWVMRTQKVSDEQAREILSRAPRKRKAKAVPQLAILELPSDEQPEELARLQFRLLHMDFMRASGFLDWVWPAL